MKLEVLAYKKNKGIVMSNDYVMWAISLLEEENSIELAKLASIDKEANIFEVEELFQKTLKELNFNMPSNQEALYDYIYSLEQDILKHKKPPIPTAEKICQIAYKEVLEEKQEEWYEISEWLGRLEYDQEFELSKEEIEERVLSYVLSKNRKNEEIL